MTFPLSDAKVLNPLCAPVAQLDRAADFESVGRGFESLRACHSFFFNFSKLNHSYQSYLPHTFLTCFRFVSASPSCSLLQLRSLKNYKNFLSGVLG